jgi:uncharacterized membrane protein
MIQKRGRKQIMTSISEDRQNQDETNDAGRWASLIGGGALVLLGLKQRSLRGALTAIAGGTLAYQAAKSNVIQETLGTDKVIKVEKTVTINQPPELLYRFWHDFANLPHFMKHLKSVTLIDNRRSHWVATGPLDASIEWDAEILEDRENELISWASVPGADVDNSGFVRFKPATGDRGTEVKVVMEYAPPGGALTSAIAKLFGEEPEQKIGDDLRRFKMLMETGEIATTAGQSQGS